MVPGAGNDVTLTVDFDQTPADIEAGASDIYYTRGGNVYRMVPGAGNDDTMTSELDQTPR